LILGRDPKRWHYNVVGVVVMKPLRSKYLGLTAYVFDQNFVLATDVYLGFAAYVFDHKFALATDV
jgi:hypothetical protein